MTMRYDERFASRLEGALTAPLDPKHARPQGVKAAASLQPPHRNDPDDSYLRRQALDKKAERGAESLPCAGARISIDGESSEGTQARTGCPSKNLTSSTPVETGEDQRKGSHPRHA
jgi:hypothetical protein